MRDTEEQSRSRFARKIERVVLAAAAFAHLYRPDEALHWKRWAAIAARGGLDVELDHQVFDEETVRALVPDGVMTTVEEYFAPRRRIDLLAQTRGADDVGAQRGGIVFEHR